jgi:hypothetical protein
LASVLTVFALAAVGCATTPSSPRDHARDRLETVVDQHQETTSFRVRLNPAPCDCPPFELRLGDAWYRVFLEPPDDDGPVGALRVRLLEAESTGTAATALVTGTLSGGVREAPNRMLCPVLQVTGLCENDRCPDAEE